MRRSSLGLGLRTIWPTTLGSHTFRCVPEGYGTVRTGQAGKLQGVEGYRGKLTACGARGLGWRGVGCRHERALCVWNAGPCTACHVHAVISGAATVCVMHEPFTEEVTEWVDGYVMATAALDDAVAAVAYVCV